LSSGKNGEREGGKIEVREDIGGDKRRRKEM
jgi:hypothetical protein